MPTSYGMYLTGNSLFPDSHGYEILELLICMHALFHWSLCNRKQQSQSCLHYFNIHFKKKLMLFSSTINRLRYYIYKNRYRRRVQMYWRNRYISVFSTNIFPSVSPYNFCKVIWHDMVFPLLSLKFCKTVRNKLFENKW